MVSVFSSACFPSVCLLWRNIYLGLLLNFIRFFVSAFFLLGCMNCLYILEINALSVASFSNDAWSVGCHFILSMVSFAVQKFLSLIRSHLFIFRLYFHYSRR